MPFYCPIHIQIWPITFTAVEAEYVEETPLAKKRKSQKVCTLNFTAKKKYDNTERAWDNSHVVVPLFFFFLRSEVQYGLPTCPKQHVVCTPHAYPIPRFANNTGFFFFPRDGVEELEERS